MKKVEKKTWPDMFEKILAREKVFDVRLADFKISEGDMLILQEWDPKTRKYTGREIKKKVGFVFKTKDAKFWKIQDIEKYGFQVISLK